MQSTDVDVSRPRANPYGRTSALQPRVDQGAKKLVATIAFAPKGMQLVKSISGHFQSSPDPIGGSIISLHLNFHHSIVFVGDHRIEESRLLDGKEEHAQGI